jgi:hypothetical protein
MYEGRKQQSAESTSAENVEFLGCPMDSDLRALRALRGQKVRPTKAGAIRGERRTRSSWAARRILISAASANSADRRYALRKAGPIRGEHGERGVPAARWLLISAASANLRGQKVRPTKGRTHPRGARRVPAARWLLISAASANSADREPPPDKDQPGPQSPRLRRQRRNHAAPSRMGCPSAEVTRCQRRRRWRLHWDGRGVVTEELQHHRNLGDTHWVYGKRSRMRTSR